MNSDQFMNQRSPCRVPAVFQGAAQYYMLCNYANILKQVVIARVCLYYFINDITLITLIDNERVL